MTNTKRLGTMVDCSRNAVMKVDTVKSWVDLTSKMGYNALLLYTEDTYEVDNQPYFGYMRGRYSKDEIKQIDRYCAEKGMEFIPCIQTLAHLGSIFRWPDYHEINDCADILLVGDEKTYELIDDMFATLSRTITGRLVNIGMDEAHWLGKGKYFDRHGLADREEIFIDHLKRVAEIGAKYGFKLLMWSDMFFRLANNGEYDAVGAVNEQVKAKIPENVTLVYWDYYSTDKAHYDAQISGHKSIKNDLWFAGGLWTWNAIAPLNRFSINASSAAIKSCAENKVDNLFFTLWGDNGSECSKISMLPALYFAAQSAKGNFDMDSIKRGFYQMFGIDFDLFCLADLPNTPYKSDTVNCNTEKYMLFNDCFCGLYDNRAVIGGGNAYAECAEKLAPLQENEQFGYIFKTLKCLCDVMEIKFDLGLRTRNAYEKRDMTEIKRLVDDYDRLCDRLGLFYDALCYQWERENKPYGFEVQDIRLGGLIQRVRHCKSRLEAFADGKVDKIDELDEKRLETEKDFDPSQAGVYNWWGSCVTVNLM